MRERAEADDGAARGSVGEQHHGRDREDLVAAGELRMIVDVESPDVDVLLELLEDGLERAAGPAPGRPEVDDDRTACDRVVEGRPVELAHRRDGSRV